jgi:vacuolar-type H+-ATPase subunit D/Vma8
MITNSSNQGGYRKAINNLESNLNSKTNSINSEITAVKNRVNTVETEVTPIARGDWCYIKRNCNSKSYKTYRKWKLAKRTSRN